MIRPLEDWLGASIVAIAVIVIALLIGTCRPALAETIPDSKIVLAIAGEAEGLSLYEQTAIAGAIINRGTLKGVFGYGRVAKVGLSPKTRLRAEKALFQARQNDVSNHATHWLSTWDLKHCRESLISWRHKMRVTLKTKNFTFYKER